LSKFGYHGSSLGSLEIAAIEFADPENLAIQAKIVSISCTKMNSCLFQCLADIYHCDIYHCEYWQFSRFSRKSVEIVNNQTPNEHQISRKHVLWSINDVFFDKRCNLQGRWARTSKSI